MSETTDISTTSTDALATTETDVNAEVAKWKALSRQNEERAKANAEAADKLAKLEDSSKSEMQRLAERIDAAESSAAQARAEATRMRVATEHGISKADADLFLTGSDESTLTRQAERLAARDAEKRSNAAVVTGEGNPTIQTGSTDTSEFARRLFNRD